MNFWNPEETVDPNNLHIGTRYTFYLHDGQVIRGTLESYRNWEGVPNGGVRLIDYSVRYRPNEPFQNNSGSISLWLDLVRKIKVYTIGSDSIPEDVKRLINSYAGGRQFRKSKKVKKSRKSKQTKKSRKSKKKKNRV
jgi:hypothetical protein